MWRNILLAVVAIGAAMSLAGCDGLTRRSGVAAAGAESQAYEYIIGPGDRLDVFVWRNPDVSIEDVPVRPDGKLSTPLVEDLVAAGKTPAQLARDIEAKLAEYIKDPLVTVTIKEFHGGFNEQIRVVGQATTPQAFPYRADVTLLDVMIAVGGLTEFAAGNQATIVRRVGGQQQSIPVRLNDLLKDGRIEANMSMAPGDILIIPESMF